MLKFPTAVLGLAFLSGSLMAAPFVEGEHYHRIGNPVSTAKDKVEVVEAFAYPCPACRNFLPHITAWEENLDEHVEFRRLPIALQRGWDLFARAYYTAEVMGLDQDAHKAMFHALHDEQRQFRSFDDVAEFYSDFGVEKDAFLNTAQSFAVDSRMRQNRNQVRQLGIRSTPTMVVQGKWRIQPGAFDSYQDMIEAVQYLVELETESLQVSANGDQAGDEENAVEIQ